MKPQPLDLESVYDKIWNKISKEWQEGLDKFNKEGIVVDFPFGEDEEIVKLAIKRTINEIKQRLKSVCEFYLRYKDDPNLLIAEHPEYKESIGECMALTSPGDRIWLFDATVISREKYNNWLFKLAFGLREVKE